MIEVQIPGFAELKLQNAIFAYNGTLAIDGYLLDGLLSKLNTLSQLLRVYIVTGDGFGTAQQELKNVNCELIILPLENKAIAKKEYLYRLNPKETVVLGNGRNDQYMLKEASLGIAILGKEGTAIEAMNAADIAIDIFSAFDLLENQHRLIATLTA